MRFPLQAVALAALAAGCGSPSPEGASTKSFIIRWNNWPAAAEGDAGVPVCVVDKAAVDGPVLSFVRDHVTREYFRKASVMLHGWETCPDAPPKEMIKFRLRLTDHWAGGLSRYGPTSTPLPDETVATTRVDAKGRDWPGPGDGIPVAWAQQVMSHTSLHEFGHALGLVHEHQRDDRPASCAPGTGEHYDPIPEGGPFNYQKVGAYDPDSVMNYCSPSTVLSEGDAAGVFALYPELKQTQAKFRGLGNSGFTLDSICDVFANPADYDFLTIEKARNFMPVDKLCAHKEEVKAVM